MGRVLFQEQAPPAGFEQLITRLWYLDAPRNARYEKILPLPLAHLIVNLSDPYRLIEADGRAIVVDGAFVAGLRTHYLISELPERLRHVVAEFTPAGLDALTTALGTGRAGAFTGGRVVPAAGVLPGADRLAARLGSLTPDAALAALTEFLCSGSPPAADPVAVAVADTLRREPGTTIESLATHLGISRRTLTARFRQAAGLAPKSYALVCRFHRLVAAAQLGTPPDWAALAAGSGFYDQPQVIRAFRRFSGWTPAEHHRRIADFGPAEAYFIPLQEVPARGTDQARS
ncbi:MAG: AraC family transcriptional regulator [Propionicimonas sp.]